MSNENLTQEIFEGTKIIMEFTGRELQSNIYDTISAEFPFYRPETIEDLDYSSSWDAQIPAWAKLEKLTIDRICKQIDSYLDQLFASFNPAPEPVEDEKIDASRNKVQLSNITDQNGIDLTWLEIWEQVEMWYGDPQKKELGRDFLLRLQAKFSTPSLVNSSLQVKPESLSAPISELIAIRNKLYNDLPTGTIDAFELIRLIKWHCNDLDVFTSKWHNEQVKQPLKSEDLHAKSLAILNKFVSEIPEEKLKALISKHQDNDPNGLTMNQYLSIMSGKQPIPQWAEYDVRRLKNGRGESHLVVITDEAVEDVSIGTAVIVPYAEGFKDPVKVKLKVDEAGNVIRVNKIFALVLEYIYD